MERAFYSGLYLISWFELYKAKVDSFLLSPYFDLRFEKLFLCGQNVTKSCMATNVTIVNIFVFLRLQLASVVKSECRLFSA